MPCPPERSHDDASAVRQAKASLRRNVLRRRKDRSRQQREADDAARLIHLRDLLSSFAPVTVAIYLSSPPEPATDQLIEWLSSRDVRVLLPVLTEPAKEGQLIGPPSWATYAGPDRLREGRLSIVEPDTEPLGGAVLDSADVIVCPGLAGNERGQRLGRGGGWYDRALADASADAITVLPLNDDEVEDDIPVDAWDRPMTFIVTPQHVIECLAPSGR